jgi:hypothetical protein
MNVDAHSVPGGDREVAEPLATSSRSRTRGEAEAKAEQNRSTARQSSVS